MAAAITGAHRGRLDVHSEPGRTEFRIELPVAEQSFTKAQPPSAHLSGPLHSPSDPPGLGYGSGCSAQITLP